MPVKEKIVNGLFCFLNARNSWEQYTYHELLRRIIMLKKENTKLKALLNSKKIWEEITSKNFKKEKIIMAIRFLPLEEFATTFQVTLNKHDFQELKKIANKEALKSINIGQPK